MAQFAVNVGRTRSIPTATSRSSSTTRTWPTAGTSTTTLTTPPLTSRPFNILAADRGVVYGVERQQLCLNEAMVVFLAASGRYDVPPTPYADHPDTQWDDTKVSGAFSITDLENVGPTPVNFKNEQWQIAVKQSPICHDAFCLLRLGQHEYLRRMRLIFTSRSRAWRRESAAGGGNSRLTIGGMVGSLQPSDLHRSQINTNPTTATPHPSYMVIDPNDTTGHRPATRVSITNSRSPRGLLMASAPDSMSPCFGNTAASGPARRRTRSHRPDTGHELLGRAAQRGPIPRQR